MSKVVHFEINVDNPQRAIKFYSSAFGWKIDKYGGGQMDYWLVTAGAEGEPGINGAIMPRNGNLTTVNTIGVASLEEAIKAVEKAGGKVTQPKMTIPKIGYFTYCLDTEGNTFGILQPDMSAE
jgi:predicted enzyme related to lactoylglutathione lyase